MEQLVGALMIKSDRILLGLRAAERRFYPNVWDVFGGHVETGETKEQALVRELREELGITLRHWTEFETLFLPHYEKPEVPLRLDLFLTKEWSGIPENRQPHEHNAINWFTLEQALKLPTVPAYQTILKNAFLKENRS